MRYCFRFCITRFLHQTIVSNEMRNSNEGFGEGGFLSSQFECQTFMDQI